MNGSVPLRYARGNVVFGRAGQAAAVYRLPSVSYALLPDSDKWGWLWTMASIAIGAKADLSIWRVQRRWPADAYVEQAVGLVDSRFADAARWRRFLEGHQPRLVELESHLPEVYLRIAQRAPAQRGGGMLRTADRWYRRVSEAFGVAPAAPIAGSEIEQLLDDEDLLLDAVRRSLPRTQPMTSRELQWLCRRAAVRHVAEPDLDAHWRPNAMVIHDPDDGGARFVPRSSDWLPLLNAAIRREDDYLVVRGYEAETYQAFLTVGTLPDEVEFPGSQAELMFRPLENLPFPVDAAIHCRWIANKKAIAEVNKAIIDAEHAIVEASSGHHVPDDLKMLNPDVGRALKTYLQSESHPPMLDATLSFAVGAPTLAELRRRVEALRDQFHHVKLYQPAGLQEHLYYEHLVRPGGALVADYDQMLTLEQFGMLMPIATRDVGNARGVYVGYTVVNARARSPVKIDVTAAARDSLPTSMYFAGRQGSGKTFAAQYVAYLAAMRGSHVITADPSPDHHITEMPEFKGESERIGLEATEAFRGMLDPLVVTPPELREELAISYYLDVLPADRPGSWETEITVAVQAVMATGGSSLAVLEALRGGNDAARELARALTVVSQSGLGILAFGDGSGGRRFADIKRVTTITMGNLPLPRHGTPRAEYDRSERLASATFKLVAAHIMWLVMQDRSVHKVVILDEAWALPVVLLDKLVRLGRKFNTTVIICSQTISDLGELKKLIGAYFIFGVNGPEEAKLAVALIGLDPDDGALIARLADKRQFQKGRCLHKDLDGRVADMQIDYVYPHILEILDTSPKAASGEAAA